MSNSAAIYAQYISYYTACNTMISAIDNLPPSERTQANVVKDRATIVAQQTLLGTLYQADAPTKTLQQFISDCAPIETTIQTAYDDAMGISPIAAEIQADATTANALASSITTSLGQIASALATVSSFNLTFSNLRAQVVALPDGPQKTKAQADLSIAAASLATLVSDYSSAFPIYSGMLTTLGQITGSNGVLAQLSALASLTNPTADNLTTANGLLAIVQNAQNALSTFQNSQMETFNSDMATLQTNLQKVQSDLIPIPSPLSIEHACWYLDWTSYTFPVPQGVNMVNLFVGGIGMVNGQPSIVGLSDLTPSQIKTFVQQCQSQNPPIAVKLSIGGAGGIDGNCWDALTSDNVDSFAQMLAEFCDENNLAGIDFDYEEYASPEQEALVGNLIARFKNYGPTLQASLCTNAGFGPSYQWQQVVTNIFEGAKDPTTGKCAVDRLYIMSYYDTMSEEQGWISQWASWANTTYGFTPAQITVGLDNFDAHAYDIGQFSAWAGTQGYSTGYWAWDPANPTASNQSTLEILNNYQPSLLQNARLLFNYLICCLLFIFGIENLQASASSLEPVKRKSRKERRRSQALLRAVPSAPPASPSMLKLMDKAPSKMGKEALALSS